MKIFVVGAEGAGKTVFLAMLSRCLNTSGLGVVLEPADYPTADYIVGVQHTLEQGEWPPSTGMGQEYLLRWRFGMTGRPNHDLLMYDSAGQDLRTLMLSEDLDDLTEDDLSKLAASASGVDEYFATLRAQMNSADVLIYLLDLDAFLGNADGRVLNEHCWLLKTFLVHPQWKDKKKLVLLSKSDRYIDLLAACDNDVRKCLRDHLPKFYPMAHLLDAPKVSFSAVSSVATETTIDDLGNPNRRPTRPFQPGDMTTVAEYLMKIAGGLPAPKRGRSKLRILETVKSVGRWFGFFGALLVFSLVGLAVLGHGCRSPGDGEQVSSLPITTEFRDSWWPGWGKVMRMNVIGLSPLSGCRIEVGGNGALPAKRMEFRQLLPGETVEVGWKELDNRILTNGDKITLAAMGFKDLTLVVPP